MTDTRVGQKPLGHRTRLIARLTFLFLLLPLHKPYSPPTSIATLMGGAFLSTFLPYSWPSFWGKIMYQEEVWLNHFKRRRQYRYLSTLYNKFPRHISVLTCRFVGCHGPVATLLRPRGNVVMGPWQRTEWLRGLGIKGVRTLTYAAKNGEMVRGIGEAQWSLQGNTWLCSPSRDGGHSSR